MARAGGRLWSVGPDDMHGSWGDAMPPRTSPSIAAAGTSCKMAFRASTGELWSIGPGDTHGSWGQKVKAGTSPSIE